MTWLPWLLVAVLALVVIWLLLALAGAGRTIAELRGDETVAASVRHLSAGIEPGILAPRFEAVTVGDGTFDAREVAGLRHLLLFADPECAACSTLVPGVLEEAAARRLPAVVVVSRGDPDTHPQGWRVADRARLVCERGTEVSDAFGVDVTPTVFVIDEGGAVVARGPVQTVPEIAELVGQAEGMRIVGAGGG